MLALFSGLSEMLTASAALAVAAAFGWGILSVVLSPCHLAGVPLLIGHIVRRSEGTKSAGIMSLLFALGILVTLLVIGVVTSLLGRIMGDTGPAASVIVGILLVVLGFNLAGIIRFPEVNMPPVPGFLTGGHAEAFILGLLFGIVLGPCSFAFMAPMMGVAFQASRTNPALSVSLFGMYALGHCAVIVLGGVLTDRVKAYLAWNERSGTVAIFKKICGVFVVIGGLYILKNSIIG